VKTSQIIPVTPGVIHYTPRRRPNIRAALIISGVCLLIAALLLLALLPVTIDFTGSSCGWTGGDTTTCEPVAYHTTRPVWLWVWGGGGR
jgi:hypothetical protein